VWPVIAEVPPTLLCDYPLIFHPKSPPRFISKQKPQLSQKEEPQEHRQPEIQDSNGQSYNG
jgi:hypothetical protein